MEKLSLCFLIIISLSSAFAQKDMSKKAFVFPKESNSSFVTLTAQLRRPFTAFTVCLRVYTDLSRAYSLFSYATRAPNVLDWRALNYTVHGEVFTKPQLWS
ncbi:C-reactive protein-like isoform X3 [Diceros bicornis minor]|uniref:C-reactive protein-like isoform X3 n=1 Tax=Diceros bicornis minor TaxID=77932 RepID=UPI0026F28455|nr:C-reactive protein-like isoform X3 [Diceros bicornis minor]